MGSDSPALDQSNGAQKHPADRIAGYKSVLQMKYELINTVQRIEAIEHSNKHQNKIHKLGLT